MESEAIIRKLKIAMITDEPNELLDWFKDLCSNIVKLEGSFFNDNKQEYIYFINKVEYHQGKRIERKIAIFYFDQHNGLSFCDYSYYWNILINRFYLDHDDARQVTIDLIDLILNKKIRDIDGIDLYGYKPITNAINRWTLMQSSDN